MVGESVRYADGNEYQVGKRLLKWQYAWKFDIERKERSQIFCGVSTC